MAKRAKQILLIGILLGIILAVYGTAYPVAAVPAAEDYVFSHYWGMDGDQLRGPGGVAVAPDGSIYVANSSLDGITRFTQGEHTFFNWGSRGKGAGQFIYPVSVALDVNGNVYVADLLNHRIQKFSSDGVFIAE